jgi:hypothetical protein
MTINDSRRRRRVSPRKGPAMSPNPIALSDEQLSIIQRHAEPLAEIKRREAEAAANPEPMA